MTNMFQVSDPSEQRGNSVTAREILDKASNDIKTGMAKDPDAQAQMMQVMGDVYDSLGLFSRARDLEQQSLDIRRRVLGPEHADTLNSMSDLADALNHDGHYAEAVKLNRETLEIRRHVLGPEHPDTLNSMNNLGDALWADGRYAEAEKLDREALDLRPSARAGTSGHNKFDEQPGGLPHLLGALSRSGEVGSGNARPPSPGAGAGASPDPEFDEQPGGCSVG